MQFEIALAGHASGQWADDAGFDDAEAVGDLSRNVWPIFDAPFNTELR